MCAARRIVARAHGQLDSGTEHRQPVRWSTPVDGIGWGCRRRCLPLSRVTVGRPRLWFPTCGSTSVDCVTFALGARDQGALADAKSQDDIATRLGEAILFASCVHVTWSSRDTDGSKRRVPDGAVVCSACPSPNAVPWFSLASQGDLYRRRAHPRRVTCPQRRLPIPFIRARPDPVRGSAPAFRSYGAGAREYRAAGCGRS